MNNAFKRLHVITNIAILAVCLLLGYVIVKNFILNPPNASKSAGRSKDPIKVGTKLSLPEVDWQKNGRTVLLVLSPTCHFCRESGPFYSKLSEVLLSQKSASLVALFPREVSEGPSYLQTLGISVNEVKQVAFDKLGVKGTPTLIIADKGGEVVGVWFGKLSSAEEEVVLKQLQAAPAG
ncbi:MAG: hypothetical protein JWM21_3590 [Acidobacteria bacterium]|nr:hypothetical protein [Acidobacteriota bacterium]